MNNSTIQSAIKSTTPAYNLGTYSNIISDEALKTIILTAGEMNFVDKGAYPQIVAMETETVGFLKGLLHGGPEVSGFATTGSSEGIIISMAWHQHNFMKAHPELKGQQLNFVINRLYHKVFEKFAHLFGFELRPAPLGADLSVDVKAFADLIDDHTFALVGIAGSTELGMVDDIEALGKLATKWSIPLHIDAAIGGYVLPFRDEMKPWDFALPAVATMNISAHKYGLCLPGIGFLMTRDQGIVPDSYNGEISYLSGGGIVDNALMCTRNAAFVVNAYHNMEKHGEEGYRAITRHNMSNMQFLDHTLQDIDGIQEVITGDAPVVAFRGERLVALSERLSSLGWIQSTHYVEPLKHTYIRIVLRRHITLDMLERLTSDIRNFYAEKNAPATVGAAAASHGQLAGQGAR